MVVMIIIIATVFTVLQIKKYLYKRNVIKQACSQTNLHITLPQEAKFFDSSQEFKGETNEISQNYKLVYQMNFDCGVCYINLKDIYNFYMTLISIKDIDFCIVTDVKSDSFIKYELDKTLGSYTIHVIQQKEKLKEKIYLLDKDNKVISTGDFTRFPFLKDEYIKKLKNQ